MKNIIFAESGTKYDRSKAAEQKNKQIGTTVTDENGDTYVVRNSGDANVLAKKIKAMNVAGFDPSMYNMDPEQEFDRQRYRDRKAIAKAQHPEGTRRERKAWALRDDNPMPIIPLPEPEDDPIPIKGRPVAKPVITVGGLENDPISVTTITTQGHNYYKVKRTADIKPVSFDQFAGLLDDRLMASKAFRTGSDLQNFQYGRAKQYEDYVNDPTNYKGSDMQDGWVASDDDIARYRNSGLLANRRSVGYYDPDAQDISSKYLFTDKTIGDALNAKGYTNGVRYEVVDDNGKVITDPTILAQFGLSDQPVYNKKAEVQATKQNIAPIGESTFSRGMSNLAMDVLATALGMQLAGPAAQFGKYAFELGKDGVMGLGRNIPEIAARTGNKVPQGLHQMSHNFRNMNGMRNSINPKVITRARNAAGDFENGWVVNGSMKDKVFGTAKDAWNYVRRYYPNSQSISTAVDTNRRVSSAGQPILDRFGQIIGDTPWWQLGLGGAASLGTLLGLESIREDNAAQRAPERQPEFREDLYYNTNR